MNELTSQINKIFEILQSQTDDLSPVMERVAAIVSTAIDRNFLRRTWSGNKANIGILSGGNVPWPPLAESTKQRYRKQGYELVRTLDRHKSMRSTIDVRQDRGMRVIATANSDYARIHQEGGTIRHPGGTPYWTDANGIHYYRKAAADKRKAAGKPVKYTKPHNIIIPPAPYITLTEEDLKDILNEITIYAIGLIKFG